MGLLKKFIEYAMGNCIVLILGFISSPIITRIISPNQMGKYSMFDTITNLLLLLILVGMDQAYVRYYYEEDINDRGELLKRSIKIPMIINLIVGALIILFYSKITTYIVQEESIFIALLIVIYLSTGIILRFAMLEIRMQQRAKLYSFFNINLKLAYILFVVFSFFIYKDDYKTLLIAAVLSNVINGLIGIYFQGNYFKKSNKNISLKTSTKEMMKFGIPIVFSTIMVWLFQSIDRLSIKSYCGYTELGLYSGTMSIIALLNALQAAFTTFWTPVAYSKYCEDSNNKYFFSEMNKIISVVMLLMSIFLILFKDLLVILLGEKYREAAFIFPYLVFMPVMATISETTVIGINFAKKTNLHICIAVISAIANLLGNTILVPIYGAKGAAISTGIAYMIFFATRTYFSNKYYKIDYNLKKFCISVLLVYILAICASFYKTNILIIIIGILNIIAIIVLYKDIFAKGIKLIKNKGWMI